ncbi:MAG TPA: aminoacetone oxidase family FAD-binding enzyme [Planctomycetes bacterium]|nr:aminoacetone oxidase family FAD-binding enzyme [Planctomycetota bacterium]
MNAGRSDCDVLVVGAGAAGLWAAARAAEGGARVCLFEKTPRAGTKVLASGGTHCNLTTTLPPEDAARLFGSAGARFLRHAFRALPPAAVREHFRTLGVETVEAPLDKVFPASGRARDVRDALRAWALRAGARLRLDSAVVGIEAPDPGGPWGVRLASGERVLTRFLVLAVGGRSFARTGTSGDGYRWLRELDLPIVEPVPALVPLTSPAGWVHELSGISLQDVEVRLAEPGGKTIARRSRPIVFTHTGISGPGAMDLSEHVARAGRPLEARLDLLPAVEREEVRALLIRFGSVPGRPGIGRALAQSGHVFPRRLVAALARQAGFERPPSCADLARASRHRLVEALKGLAVPIDGTLGFDRAEVTAGGLALGAVDPGTMQVRSRPGLFVCGELLDLQGPIGGLNFQAAFATAELVGRTLQRTVPGAVS